MKRTNSSIFMVFILSFSISCIRQIEDENEINPQGMICTGKSGAGITLSEASEIARTGICGEKGEIDNNTFCHLETDTLWMDIIPKDSHEGCSPACVIDLKTSKSSINWRCTDGMIPVDEMIFGCREDSDCRLVDTDMICGNCLPCTIDYGEYLAVNSSFSEDDWMKAKCKNKLDCRENPLGSNCRYACPMCVRDYINKESRARCIDGKCENTPN